LRERRDDIPLLVRFQIREGVIEGSRGAARILGLRPNTLRSRFKKLGVAPSNYDGS
jgi:DNA-binding NtrC family response regulator